MTHMYATVSLTSDLEGVEQQVTEESCEPQCWALGDGLVDDEGEQDAVDAQQGDQGEGGLCQSGQEDKWTLKTLAPSLASVLSFVQRKNHVFLWQNESKEKM